MLEEVIQSPSARAIWPTQWVDHRVFFLMSSSSSSSPAPPRHSHILFPGAPECRRPLPVMYTCCRRPDAPAFPAAAARHPAGPHSITLSNKDFSDSLDKVYSSAGML